MNSKLFMQTTIPIIVLNWFGIEDTLECMESLWRQTHQGFIVYLVDNGSDERNVELLKKNFGAHPKVHLILNQENLGFTRGNNVIMQQLVQSAQNYEYIALLNNDTEVHPDWLAEMLACAEKTKADIVTSKMVNYFKRSRMDNAGHLMLNTAEIIPLGHMEPVGNFEAEFENIGSCAGATLYSTEMLRKIGVFDEYFDTGYEDAEIGVRAVVTGHRSVFAPKAIVYHKISQSVGKVRDYKYLRKIQLNIFYTYFKLMPAGVLWANAPSFFFKYGAILVIDIVFLRIRFLKIMCDSIYRTLFLEREKILESRKAFHASNHTISSWQILRKQEFFLWFDIKRFWKYIILRQPTTFEKY